MSVERIVWLIIGILLLIWAGMLFFTDEPDFRQDYVDAVQNILLGVFALGLARRS